MAKYVWVETVGMFTYALDECEDYLVLDAYLKIIESGVSAQVKTIKIFEYYHFQEGGMLNDNILMQLNGFLMRMDLPTLFFVNGHTTAYAHMRGQEKTARRASMLAYLRSLTKAHRTDFIAKKQFEASVLLERDPALPTRPPVIDVPGKLSSTEVERRRAALANAKKAEAGIAPTRRTEIVVQASHADQVALQEPDFVPESTTQDNVIELITEIHDLRSEVSTLKGMLQSIFRFDVQQMAQQAVAQAR